ncbi:MAG: hypothetical protein NTW79_01340 [Candidatus Berkelbacteria bacterium]|nr:hypothetical protein [Candidatus Berkelbacteria bacterium]
MNSSISISSEKIMDKKEFNKAHEEALQKKMLEEPDYWFKPRRRRWDEWESPVGLGLFFISLAVTVYILHISGIF